MVRDPAASYGSGLSFFRLSLLCLPFVLPFLAPRPVSACSLPVGSCSPAFCSQLTNSMGWVGRVTLPDGSTANKASWQIGFYEGLWNSAVYPNQTQFSNQPGGPFVNLEVFSEVGFVVGSAAVANISQCCSLCYNTYNCTMYHFFPTVNAVHHSGILPKTGSIPGFVPGINCYLVSGGNENDTASGSKAPYGVPVSGTHSTQLSLSKQIDLSFVGGLCVNQSFIDNGTAASNCSFNCTPAGSFLPGKFFQQGPAALLLTGFVEASPSNPPQRACYDLCASYNLAHPTQRQAGYWQLEDDGNGGTCQCFDSGACSTKGFNATAVDGGSRFYVGQVCGTGGKGDPHFKGADGSRFDFSGEPNKVYALVSDAHLQINAFFGGRYGAYNGNPRKALTWMRSVALLFGHHALLLEARAGPSAEYGSGYLGRLALDGEALPLPGVGDRLALLGGQLEVVQTRAAEKDGDDLVDEFEVFIGGVAKVVLVLRPEVEELRTEEDGLVHFEVDLVEAQLSSNAHGVIGQTYRPDFAGRLAQQTLVFSAVQQAMVVPGDSAEGFLDGSVADYQCSAIDAANCRFCRFRRAPVEGAEEEMWKWSVGREGGVAAPRRALLK